jgi:hypothetical protein
MIRFAIWAAVSTKEQAAPDKPSLDNQVEKCRSAGISKGWQESSGPYVTVASRSFYVNLSDAENEIPDLKKLLDDAHANLYDVLMVNTYDRLGDLVDLVAQPLRFDKVQLYSLNQAVEPQPPETFDPYNAEAEGIMRDVSRITQRFRIDDLRRKYRAGMPVRVKRGLTPFKVPYGYIWTGKKTPPRRDPLASAVVLRIRDEYMVGKSINSIALRLASDGVPSPNGHDQWVPTTIRYILHNSYYAGLVTLGKTVRLRDPRHKNNARQLPQPASRWESSPGQHEPLWDIDTHKAIQAELARRKEMSKNNAIRYPFSGLLRCGVCGKKVERVNSGHGNKRRRILACTDGVAHVRIEYPLAVKKISQELATALAARTSNPLPASEPDPAAQNEKKLADLAARRKRVQAGFESGIYTTIEAAEKLSALKQQEETLQEKLRVREQSTHAWDDWQKILIEYPDLYDHYPEWIQSEDPALINRLLMTILDGIKINHDLTIEIVWRK